MWTSPNGEGSAHHATSIPGLKDRVALWARANGIPAPAGVLDAVFARLQAPGSPFELEEAHVRTDDGSTNAPHLTGPRQTGQVSSVCGGAGRWGGQRRRSSSVLARLLVAVDSCDVLDDLCSLSLYFAILSSLCVCVNYIL